MKHKILALFAIVILWSQPLLAGSAPEGGEKQALKKMQAPTASARVGDLDPRAAILVDDGSELEQTPTAKPQAATASVVVETDRAPRVATEALRKFKPLHVLRGAKSQGDDAETESGIFGGLSFLFGWLSLIFALATLFLAPLWLLAAIFAIAGLTCGIIGVGRKRKMRGMAIAGLVISPFVLLFVLPTVFIYLIVSAIDRNGYFYWG